jgi:hypothetical protein
MALQIQPYFPFFTVLQRIEEKIKLQCIQPQDLAELLGLIKMEWGRMRDKPAYLRGAMLNIKSKLRVIAALRGKRIEGEMMANYYNQVPN